MEIKKVTKENLMDLFYPCGPNEISYINAKKFIVNLWREKRLKSGFLGFVAYENEYQLEELKFGP
jgi:SHS2 domain-containing protein